VDFLDPAPCVYVNNLFWFDCLPYSDKCHESGGNDLCIFLVQVVAALDTQTISLVAL
jgi:hypothetical protein